MPFRVLKIESSWYVSFNRIAFTITGVLSFGMTRTANIWGGVLGYKKDVSSAVDWCVCVYAYICNEMPASSAPIRPNRRYCRFRLVCDSVKGRRALCTGPSTFRMDVLRCVGVGDGSNCFMSGYGARTSKQGSAHSTAHDVSPLGETRDLSGCEWVSLCSNALYSS